jgi:hypothetical protein
MLSLKKQQQSQLLQTTSASLKRLELSLLIACKEGTSGNGPTLCRPLTSASSSNQKSGLHAEALIRDLHADSPAHSAPLASKKGPQGALQVLMWAPQ